MTDDTTTTLYRPVGPNELALIEASGFAAFPPRLSWQPIFYPVLNEEYATQIARDWNVKQSGAGFVTRFQVRSAFLARYEIQTVGHECIRNTGSRPRSWRNSIRTLWVRSR
jgi:hypothetical protein